VTPDHFAAAEKLIVVSNRTLGEVAAREGMSVLNPETP
jgi:hypothetical protein